MPRSPSATAHIGTYIREFVLPKGLAVTAAAEKLGVGRPALSSLLNGRAALSPDMAGRLEKAFAANAEDLLQRQESYQQQPRKHEAKAVGVRRYAPHFLTIKAVELEAWAQGHLHARQYLAVLLRKLIHSTGLGLSRVDFPGYDNAERKGADGIVQAEEATAWIPAGLSHWEFGTTDNPQRKANDDFTAKLRSTPKSERLEMTYVQVTPFNWPKKTDWEKANAAKNEWKAVRVLDASDLEQWLEESIPAQMWLAEKLMLPSAGYETLEACWERWANPCEPRMSKALFASAIEAHGSTFEGWLKRDSEAPLVVAADSTDEALAFLACLTDVLRLSKPEVIERRAGDLALVFRSGEVLKKVSAASTAFIPIAANEGAERELASLYRDRHCIIVRPKNAVDREADIALELLGYEAFQKALTGMSVAEDRIDQLGRECGYSPTILRRRLSERIPAIHKPAWAGDPITAKQIVPMALIGAWHAKSTADREIVEIVSGHPYEEVESDLMRLLAMDDPPVWSVGEYRGVASKSDALFAVAYVMTADELERFFEYAKYVLSEADPALDLPEDKRWMASVYKKVRDHSGALRAGVCETLVLLAVHGNTLFRERLGIDCEVEVSRTVQKLLTPLSLQKLQSHERDLPRYAEAAPDTLLSILEEDLDHDDPILFGLLKPVKPGMFGNCLRTGLLWALEGLAWQPRILGRVSLLLARLSQTTIDDNWANKPIASLEAIFRCWIPQTAASLSARIGALETVVKRLPDIGWQICIAQFGFGSSIGDHSHRPEWRNDASGAGQPVTLEEMRQFQLRAVELCLAWPGHTDQTLGDLVERLDCLRKDHVRTVWAAIEQWSVAADDRAKARLRERIRRFAFTRRGQKRKMAGATRDHARDAYRLLQPADLVVRHAWLFEKQWVDESADESGEDYDSKKRGEWLDETRLAAMRELWAQGGLSQALALLSRSQAPWTIGYYAAKPAASADSVALLHEILRVPASLSVDSFLGGFIGGLDSPMSVIQAASEGLAAEERLRLLRCAPFDQEVWNLVASQGDEFRDEYWRAVPIRFQRFEESELTTAIDHLLAVGRSRTAFTLADVSWEKVETSRIKRLLSALATITQEPSGIPVPQAHDIAQALETLNDRPDVTEEEMARFEFLYLEVLEHTQHQIPNLEKQISKSPELFAQAVAYAFKRADGQEDPPELRLAKEQEHVARSAYDLLRRMERIPGTKEDGGIDPDRLQAWVTDVRRVCGVYGRSVMGDQMLGQLLSHAPSDKDGLWPCRAVCTALEAFRSKQMGRGFSMGVHNNRGAVWRGRGGNQERGLAAQYRGWARKLASEFPFVGALVEDIAHSYDWEAQREDIEEKVTQRLRR